MRQTVHMIVATALSLTMSAAAFSEESSELQRPWDRTLGLVNEARSRHGLQPLEWDPQLNEAAQTHAEGMLEGGYYGHVSPEGEAPMDRYLDAGGESWRAVKENIARCSTCEPPTTVDNLERLHDGWMDSPSHRRNILGEGLSRFGFGAAIDERQGLYAVQMFAGPGTPRGLETGEKTETLSPEEQHKRAVELINRARRRANALPLEPSEALADAAGRMLPERGLGELSLAEIGSPFEALTEQERGRWRSLSLVVGSCGGCGAQPTAADLRYFRRQWLENSQHKSVLLDPSFTQLGFVMRTNGEGRKVALVVLGNR